jgi:transcriptional regulator with XRE-family HTH domain
MAPMKNSQFGKAAKKERQRQNRSVADVARKAGVKADSLRTIEERGVTPSVDRAAAILESLGRSWKLGHGKALK